jgi:lipopolysaccharide export system permease protein
MKTLDRYLLRELAFPFLIALVGFLIFVLLNLILGLRDFMLDRAISLGAILGLLAYQLPFFLVLSLPVATLFAIFLALGRLVHDREIIALQASGLSLKRIVLPILIASLVISGFGLFLNDRMVPWANQRYQGLIRQLILKRATPQIQDNTFFKDPQGRFFYVKHYDRRSGQLEGIMVYDLTGAAYLPELGGRYPNVIVADEGSWDGEVWHLRDGVVHKYDEHGHLEYELRFDSLAIDVGGGLEQLFLASRTPQEMSLAELAAQIRLLRASGLRAEGLIVEYHSKLAIPLAGFIFALFGAPLSLIFSTRSRAAGIVLGVLLVGLFQGGLVWTSTLGRRGLIPPGLSAWLPNILFGGLGLFLFAVMDRASQLDLSERLRRSLHRHLLLACLVILFLPASASAVGEARSNLDLDQPGEEAPLSVSAEPRPKLELRADSLTLSADWAAVSAEGHVTVTYGDSSLVAERLEMSRSGRRWALKAEEGIELSIGVISARGDELRAELEEDNAGRLSLKEAEFLNFSGEERVPAPSGDRGYGGEGHSPLKYRAGRARLTFGPAPASSPPSSSSRGLAFELERLELSSGAEVNYRDGRVAAEEIIVFPAPKGAPSSWQAELGAFRGEGGFTNARGERHLLRYEGERAELAFTAEAELERLELTRGAFTTCSCREEIKQEAYCITAERVLIFGEDLLVGMNITLWAFGRPVFWAPLYLAPMKEEQKGPFLPELGRSTARGWFAKWRLPFALDEHNYGFVLLDYFNRYHQLGGGVDLSYDLLGHSGSLHLYQLFGELGLFELALSDRALLPQGVRFELAADYRSQLEAGVEGQWMGYQGRLAGARAGWSWTLSTSHEQYVGMPAEGEELKYRALARLPELTLSRLSQKVGPLNYSFSLSFGRYRERKLEQAAFSEGTRFAGLVSLGLEELSFREGRLKLRANGSYRLAFYGPTRLETLTFSPSLGLLPLEGLNLSLAYSYRLVRGRSPFAFDTEAQASRLDLRGSWSPRGLPGLQGRFAAGYDFQEKGFAPLELELSYRYREGQWRLFDFDSSLGLEGLIALGLGYDLNKGQLQKAALKGSLALAAAGWNFTAESGLDFLSGRFSDLVAKLAAGQFKLGLRYDLNKLALKRVNAELALGLTKDWKASFKGEYDLGLGRLTTFQYGLVRSFCGCWEVGLFADQGRWWLTARINAFPTAAIKYSPTDQELAFGE